MDPSPITFTFLPALWIGLAIVLLAVIVAAMRRAAIGRATALLALLGMGLLCLAAAGATWHHPDRQSVAVMVDLSPSTRTAHYRDSAQLQNRIRELLGNTPYRIHYFSDGLLPTVPSSSVLADVPAQRTSYPSPAATAVLLFSDAQFELPRSGPPTYAVIDPALDDPPDAQVRNLQLTAKNASITLSNGGRGRSVAFQGVDGESPTTLPSGSIELTRPINSGATLVSATIIGRDPWPENDSLSAIVCPPVASQRWWIGGSEPGTDWVHYSPESLPTDPSAYLAPSIIVLNDVAAAQLDLRAQHLLAQYVSDLGGGLVILGGEHAFASGNYYGSALETLSPLSSTPPQPTTLWMVLVDSSGSMSEAATGSATRWQCVLSAVDALLPQLPPEDLLSVGSFASEVKWWSWAKSAGDYQLLKLPPPNVAPYGPTNLQQALETLAAQAESKLPTQLLLLTDADASVDKAPELAARLHALHTRVSLMAIGSPNARGLAALKQIVAVTGGNILLQPEAEKWAATLRELMHSVSPRYWNPLPIQASFENALSGRADVRAAAWNKTWPKSGSTILAEGTDAGGKNVLAAQWQDGQGQVIAAGFAPDRSLIDALVKLGAAKPRDPRFHLTWQTGAQLGIDIDAIDAQHYLNDQSLTLEMADAADPNQSRNMAVPQIGPGHYALLMNAPTRSTLATVRANGRVLDRIAVAGRYPVEFSSIGNDHAAMHLLADRTGGAVIGADEHHPIQFHWPDADFPLGTYLTLAGALCIAAALLWWKFR